MKKLLLLALGGVFAVSQLFAGIPLPEHPRPDWERSAWMNLNGEWDFGFKISGRKGEKYDRKILVPFGWGSPLSGVKDESSVGYYRRGVTVPAEWKDKRVFLVIGAADHDTTCTFDGNRLGKHVGGYTPFEFELTDYVQWGKEQKIELEIWDPNPKDAQDGHYLYGKQGYGNCRGIWQTVYLEARGDVYLDHVRIVPEVSKGQVAVNALLSAPAKVAMTCDIEVDGRTEKIEFAPGAMIGSVAFALENPKLWDLDNPYLYDVALKLRPTEPLKLIEPADSTPLTRVDEVKTYFGYREVSTGFNANGDAYVTLNGKPLYLQLCLDQSYHPEGWYTFPSDEVMKHEIEISKELALSGNRVHIKVEVPRKLYWADRLGILIQADVPCAWGDASEAMFEEHWNCFLGMLKRDFNHPCVYQWTLFNETWGLFTDRSLADGLSSGRNGRKSVYRPWTQREVAKAYLRAKFMDPTRIIEDNSPCKRDHVVTDVNTWHSYCPGYGWEQRVTEYCTNTYVGSSYNYIGGNVQHGEPMMNSECGNVWGYAGSTGDVDWSWDYHLMLNAFRRHLKCAGWLYTEHHDVVNEWNGYVRFDRTAKETGLEELGMKLQDLHAKAVLFFAGKPGWETAEVLPVGTSAIVPVGVSLTTDDLAGRKLALRRSMWYYNARGEKKRVSARTEEGSFEAKAWQCEKLWDVKVDLPAEPACGAVVFELLVDGAVASRNVWCFSAQAEIKAVAEAAADGSAAPTSDKVVPTACYWDQGTANVRDGLKFNGFGKGWVEFVLDAPAAGGTFVAELGSKRKQGKDFGDEKVATIDRMLGGGSWQRGKNRNSYPMTSAVDKFPANVTVKIGGRVARTLVLPDDPADHRGILSWLNQAAHDWKRLEEAGSYGYLVTAAVLPTDVKDGKVTVRIESDNGLAVYGPRFGRYPLGPSVGAFTYGR